ncbi:hypothetical protein AAVH_25388 [Aphelenchoides avenae]|nr:hypothetical protein AAVH_25388 [Aphelenchus avenae]
MPKRGNPSSYLEDAASLEAKRQRQSSERQERYLRREKQKAIALAREKRRVRLTLEGYVDVFMLLPREDLNTLEISCSTFHSIVTVHLYNLCLVAVDFARVEHCDGYIVLDGEVKFRAVDESYTDAVPDGRKHFRENVYVLLHRVASKCLIKRMLVNYPESLDDVACKALIAIQPNVGIATFDSNSCNRTSTSTDVTLDLARSALFGFQSVIFPSFRASYDVFTGRAIQRAKDFELGKIWLDAPKDQACYHDDELISLLSIKSGNRHEPAFYLKGLRLSSQFFLKVLEAHLSNALSENFSCSISGSEVAAQNRGTHIFVETAHQFCHIAKLQLTVANLPRLGFAINLANDIKLPWYHFSTQITVYRISN